MNITRIKLWKNKLVIASFVAIPVALLLAFTIYPAIKLCLYSFTDYDGLSPEMHFVGLYNWKKLFSDIENIKTLWHSAYYMIGGIVQNILALALAVILCNKKIKGKTYLRAMIVLPFVLNGTAVSYMFRYLFDYSKGPLNLLLQNIGLDAVSWLGNEKLVNWSLAFVQMWMLTGYLMIIYIGALQSIPYDYYEAATIDGASGWQKFRYITLPQITPIIGLQMFLNISGSINIFNTPFVLTGGGPNNASRTFAMKTVETAFSYNNYGLASAYGVFCAILIGILYVVQTRVLNRKEAS